MNDLVIPAKWLRTIWIVCPVFIIVGLIILLAGNTHAEIMPPQLDITAKRGCMLANANGVWLVKVRVEFTDSTWENYLPKPKKKLIAATKACEDWMKQYDREVNIHSGAASSCT